MLSKAQRSFQRGVALVGDIGHLYVLMTNDARSARGIEFKTLKLVEVC